METKEFKKIIDDVFKSNGLDKKGSYYYKKSDEVIFIVGLQKSAYSNAFYINIGFILKKLNPNLEYPKDVDGDLRTRFSYKDGEKSMDVFDLEKFNEGTSELIKKYLLENLSFYLNETLSINGIKKLLEKKPSMLYQVKINAKKFLGYD